METARTENGEGNLINAFDPTLQDGSPSQLTPTDAQESGPFPDTSNIFGDKLVRTKEDMTSLASSITRYAFTASQNWGFDRFLSFWTSMYHIEAMRESVGSQVLSLCELSLNFPVPPAHRHQDADMREGREIISANHYNSKMAKEVYLAKIEEQWGERIRHILQSAEVACILLRLCAATSEVLPWAKMQCRVQKAAFDRGMEEACAPTVKPGDFWRALVLPEETVAPTARELEKLHCRKDCDGLLEQIGESGVKPPRKQDPEHKRTRHDGLECSTATSFDGQGQGSVVNEPTRGPKENACLETPVNPGAEKSDDAILSGEQEGSTAEFHSTTIEESSCETDNEIKEESSP